VINKKSIKAVDGGKFSSQFRKPDSLYNFANLFGTLEKILTSKTAKPSLPSDVLGDYGQERFDNVVVFFIDAFGWKFIREHISHPFLARIERQGVLSKLTAQFPSTTAAQMTSIHTGLPVGESGIYEWFFYEPTLDAVIAPLLFSFAGDKRWETLIEAGVNPESILPVGSFYLQLKSQQIKSFAFQSREYTPSTYSTTVLKGTKILSYKTLPEALVNLGQILSQKEKAKRYFFLYYSAIDSIGHKYGPNSKQFNVEINVFLDIMEAVFMNGLKDSGHQKTLFLMFADHGQTTTNPKTIIYLNEQFPEIIKMLKMTEEGSPIVPCGSPRDMFLHVRNRHEDEVLEILKEGLRGKAEIYKTKKLINEGFFGKKISRRFLDRVGDLVILPYEGGAVWWHERGRFKGKNIGGHGGLSPAEMEIGLGVLGD